MGLDLEVMHHYVNLGLFKEFVNILKRLVTIKFRCIEYLPQSLLTR